MFDGMEKLSGKTVPRSRQGDWDRRSFLKGSAVFAAALGLSVATSAFAQDPPQQKPQEPKPEEQKPQEEKPEEKDPFAEEEKLGNKENETKVDKDGREYRTCPQCAANMYRQGRTWTCENCGYSYVE
jgi:ribosomal protein S27AE